MPARPASGIAPDHPAREVPASVLRRFYDNVPLMMGVVELREDDILHVTDNAASATFFGTSPAALQSRFASELGVDEPTIRRWIDRYRASKGEENGVQFTYTHETPEAQLWLKSTVSYIGTGPSGHDRYAYFAENVTEQLRISQDLKATAERLEALVSNLQAGVLVEDHTGHVLIVNQQFCDLFSVPVPPEALVGANCAEAAEGMRDLFADPVATFSRIGEVLTARETVLADPVEMVDGRTLERDYVPITFEGAYQGHLWLYHDVTERLEAGRELQKREARYRLLAENTTDLIALHAQDGTYEWVSQSSQGLLGYSPDELVGMSPYDLMHPEDLERIRPPEAPEADPFGFGVASGENAEVTQHTFRVRHANGQEVWMEMVAKPIVEDGRVVRIQSASRDISERQAMEDELFRQAFHDPLTGLPNRALFSSRLEEVVAGSQDRSSYAVLFLDLDRFKVINDTLGHSAGDMLLTEVSTRIQNILRSSDTVARLSGDEFAVLLDRLPRPGYAEDIAQRILDTFRRPIDLGGRPVFAGASIGIVKGRPDHDCPDALLREADLAMYEAKRGGKGRYATFNESVHGLLSDQLRLEMDLRHAVGGSQLRVVYQPIVRLEDGDLAGFEALVRWEHPVHGLLAPDAFLQSAEASGELIHIDRWVLREACREAAVWAASRGQSQSQLVVNVNCSGREFLTGDYASDVLAVLGESGLGHGQLALEITERALIEDEGLVSTELARLQVNGVHSSIDDFGTGYSSLRTLRSLPVGTVKVDRSFVSEMDAEDESRQLVEAVIQLGRILGKSVVAEGIEEPTHLSALREMGCTYGQGYLFSRPVSGIEAASLAASRIYPWQDHWTATA